MVKTNKKSLLLTMLVVLFSAILLVGGFVINGNKPQVDAKVKAESSVTIKQMTYHSYLLNLIDYDITNLTITTDDNKKPENYLQIRDISTQDSEPLNLYVFENGVDQNGQIVYDCVIYADVDVIYANEYSGNLFTANQTYDTDTSFNTLKTITLENFDTSNATNMECMFYELPSLESIDFGNRFDTSNVTSMECMFQNCASLTNLDLSGFNTKNVTDMGGMFSGCFLLTNLDLSSFNTENVTDFGAMFSGVNQSFESMGLSVGLDMDSPTFYREVYAMTFGTEFVSQDGDDTNDEQEAKNAILSAVPFTINDKMSGCLDLSNFVISSTANTDEMFMMSGFHTIIAPKECNHDSALFFNYYEENTDIAHTVINNSTKGKTLVAFANESSYDNSNSGTQTPATGFDMNDIVLTTTLGVILLVAIAVVFGKTKKRYDKR